MKMCILALTAAIGLVFPSASTYAQTPTPAPAPTLGPSAAPAANPPQEDAAAPEDDKGKIKEIRQACREQLKGQGLKGDEKVKAVSDCLVKQRPDLAQREQCRMTGWEKGLRKHELNGFVKDCLDAKG